MSYIVRANGFEVECGTVEEVRALIGVPVGDGEAKPRVPPTNGGNGSTGGRSDGAQRSPTDHALLKALVEGGTVGIESNTALGLLSARGRGVPGAFVQWAARMNLPQDSVESTRVGVGRGWRLTSGALAAARVILDGGGT